MSSSTSGEQLDTQPSRPPGTTFSLVILSSGQRCLPLPSLPLDALLLFLLDAPPIRQVLSDGVDEVAVDRPAEHWPFAGDGLGRVLVCRGGRRGRRGGRRGGRRRTGPDKTERRPGEHG